MRIYSKFITIPVLLIFGCNTFTSKENTDSTYSKDTINTSKIIFDAPKADSNNIKSCGIEIISKKIKYDESFQPSAHMTISNTINKDATAIKFKVCPSKSVYQNLNLDECSVIITAKSKILSGKETVIVLPISKYFNDDSCSGYEYFDISIHRILLDDGSLHDNSLFTKIKFSEMCY